jgi:hypothetical protein
VRHGHPCSTPRSLARAARRGEQHRGSAGVGVDSFTAAIRSSLSPVDRRAYRLRDGVWTTLLPLGR